MTPAGNGGNDVTDTAFAAAWSVFAADDARASAPPALEARVREAARAACRRRQVTRRTARGQQVLAALGMAAVLALVAGGLLWQRHAGETTPQDAHVSTVVDVGQHAVSSPAFEVGERGRTPLAALAVDPVQDTEQLVLVHIRVPSDALLALGIATNEPGIPGLVDVEVLVGGDGLPRDIRSMRTVLTAEEKD
jgi:hypothetical protein